MWTDNVVAIGAVVDGVQPGVGGGGEVAGPIDPVGLDSDYRTSVAKE